jgi:hypothetical protein
MIDEHDMNESIESEELEGEEEAGSQERLTQAARREKLASMQARIGEHAQLDGDVIVIEAGEPVVLHIELDREGEYTLTWWATALNEKGHHRWRDAAGPLLEAGESIHTSALGGGYLIEIEQTSNDEEEVLRLAGDQERVERVRTLLTAFPAAVSELPAEPVPDYLLPPEPELPELGEAEAEDVEAEDEGDEEDFGNEA